MKLFFEQIGSGEPLIMIHGNGSSHQSFEICIEILKKHFTVYALDSRGQGANPKEKELHYTDMADDVIEFCHDHDLEHPIIYGFSDGGIIALLVAIKSPQLPSHLIVSGANMVPSGLKARFQIPNRFKYWKTKDPLYKLMLTEPHITEEMLHAIKAPTLITAGEKDIVKERETRRIAQSIPGSKMIILPGEGHGTYITHDRPEKIASIILEETR
jgi:pimeloyl-ACP methyl ester carboxylesterase